MKGKIICIIVCTLLIAAIVIPIGSSKNTENNNQEKNNTLSDMDTTIYLDHILEINPTNNDQKAISSTRSPGWEFHHFEEECFTYAIIKPDTDYIMKWGLDGPPPTPFDPLSDILVFKYGRMFEEGGVNVIELMDEQVEIEQIAKYYHNGEFAGETITNTNMVKTGNGTYFATMISNYTGQYPPCPNVSLDEWEEYLMGATRSIILRSSEPGHVNGYASYYIDFVDLEVTIDTHYKFDTDKVLPHEEIFVFNVESIDINPDDLNISMVISDYIDPALHAKRFIGGLGVSTVFENLGLEDTEEVECTISIDAPLFLGGKKIVTVTIEAGEEYNIRSGLFLGLGWATITASIYDPNPVPAIRASWKTTGFLIGPFAIFVGPNPLPA